MKLNKLIALGITAVVAAGLVTACNNSDTGNDDVVVLSSNTSAVQTLSPDQIKTADEEGYYFEYNGVKVRVNTNAADAVAQLGDDYYYFEADSCAGVGLSKTYTYGNNAFVISTVPVGDMDIISTVTLFDDSVATPEGIFRGSTRDDVIAAYGEPTTDIAGTLTYELNDTMLVIITSDDGVVTGITYNQIV